MKRNERWRIIPGWSLYEVSDYGCVRRRYHTAYNPSHSSSRHRKRRFRAKILPANPSGRTVYLKINDNHTIEHKRISIAYLVLLTFKGPPPLPWGKRKGCCCARHLDDQTSNNHLSNLAWGTQKENMSDAMRNGKFRSSVCINVKQERKA